MNKLLAVIAVVILIFLTGCKDSIEPPIENIGEIENTEIPITTTTSETTTLLEFVPEEELREIVSGEQQFIVELFRPLAQEFTDILSDEKAFITRINNNAKGATGFYTDFIDNQSITYTSRNDANEIVYTIQVVDQYATTEQLYSAIYDFLVEHEAAVKENQNGTFFGNIYAENKADTYIKLSYTDSALTFCCGVLRTPELEGV